MSSPGLKMRFYAFRDNPPRLQYTKTPPRTPPSPQKSTSKNPPSPPRRNTSLRQENPPESRASQAEKSPRFKTSLSNRLSFPKGVNPFNKGRESSPARESHPWAARETALQLEPRPQTRINFPRGVTLTFHGQGEGAPDREGTTVQGKKSPHRFHQASLGQTRFPKGVSAIQQAPEQEVRQSSARFPKGEGASQQAPEQKVRVFPARLPKGVGAIQQATENQEVRIYPRKATSPRLETTFPAENTQPTRVALPRGATLPNQETLHPLKQTPTTFPKGVEPFLEQTTTVYHQVDSRTPLTRITLPKGAQLPHQDQSPSHHIQSTPTARFPKGAEPFHRDHSYQKQVENRSPTARVTLPKGAHLPQQSQDPPEHEARYNPPGKFPKGAEPFNQDHTQYPERETRYIHPGRFPKGAAPFHQDHTHYPRQGVDNRSPTARVTLPKGAHLPQQISQHHPERESLYHPPGRFPKGAEPFNQNHPQEVIHSPTEGDSVSRWEKNPQVSPQRESVPPRGCYLNFPKGVTPIQHREHSPLAGNTPLPSENTSPPRGTLYHSENTPSPRPTSQQTDSTAHINQNTVLNTPTVPWEGNSPIQSQQRPQETAVLTRGENQDSSQASTPSTQNQNPSSTTVTPFTRREVIPSQDQKPPSYSITTTRVTTNIGHKPPVAPRKSLENLNQEFSLNRGNYLDKNNNKSPVRLSEGSIRSREGSVRSPKSPIRSPGRSPVRSGRSRLSGRFGSKSEPRLDRHSCGSTCTLTLYFSPSSPTSSPRRAYKSADDLCDSSNDVHGPCTSSRYNSSDDDHKSTTTTTTTAPPTSSTARYIRTALSPIWFRISNSAPSSTLSCTSTRPVSSRTPIGTPRPGPDSSVGATRPDSRTIWRSEITPRSPSRSLAQREVRK